MALAVTPIKRLESLCVNQLISSHRLLQYFELSCTQNSERLLRTPVDFLKIGIKIAAIGEGADGAGVGASQLRRYQLPLSSIAQTSVAQP